MFSVDSRKGTYSVVVSDIIYVERSDVREWAGDDRSFYGISQGKTVRLKYGPMIKIESIQSEGNNGEVVIFARIVGEETVIDESTNINKKSVIHWVSQEDSISCEMRIYQKLFTLEKPLQDGETMEQRMREINPHSLKIHSNSKINSQAINELESCSNASNRFKRIQLERVGYFIQDIDTSTSKPIFNMIIDIHKSY